MLKADYHDIFHILSTHDEPFSDHAAPEPDSSRILLSELANYFADREFTTTILGVDIYQYSRMPNQVQRVIPTLFDYFRRGAAAFCEDEPALFKEDKGQLTAQFIPTGDGGFQVLPTPLHALAFAAFLQMFVTLYNGFRIFPKFRAVTDAIAIRYAVTTGHVFQQDANFFGPAIIRNARILARDSLNRFLLDHESVNWFNRHTINLDTLTAYTLSDIQRIDGFESHPKPSNWRLFSPNEPGYAIRLLTLHKLDAVQSKETILQIYSLHAQLQMKWTNKKTNVANPVMVTLGNLNTQGIVV